MFFLHYLSNYTQGQPVGLVPGLIDEKLRNERPLCPLGVSARHPLPLPPIPAPSHADCGAIQLTIFVMSDVCLVYNFILALEKLHNVCLIKIYIPNFLLRHSGEVILLPKSEGFYSAEENKRMKHCLFSVSFDSQRYGRGSVMLNNIFCMNCVHSRKPVPCSVEFRIDEYLSQ